MILLIGFSLSNLCATRQMIEWSKSCSQNGHFAVQLHERKRSLSWHVLDKWWLHNWESEIVGKMVCQTFVNGIEQQSPFFIPRGVWEINKNMYGVLSISIGQFVSIDIVVFLFVLLFSYHFYLFQTCHETVWKTHKWWLSVWLAVLLPFLKSFISPLHRHADWYHERNM